MGMTMHQDRIC